MLTETFIFALLWLAILYYFVYHWGKTDRPQKADVETMIPLFTGRPVMWIFVYPTTNSRNWADFGSRKMDAVNLPWVNLCVSSIVNQNPEYNIHIVTPTNLSLYLPEITFAPSDIQHQEELRDWIKWSLLAKYGGTWITPTCVCLESMYDITLLTESCEMAVIGCDSSTAVCLGDDDRVNTDVIAVRPKSAIAARIADAIGAFYNNKLASGYEFRQSEQYIVTQEIRKNRDSIMILPGGLDGTRTATGRPVSIENLLSQNEVAFPEKCRMVLMPDDILRRDIWGWFNRMSEKQVLMSDMCISRLLRESLPHDVVMMIVEDDGDEWPVTAASDILGKNVFNTQPQLITFSKA